MVRTVHNSTTFLNTCSSVHFIGHTAHMMLPLVKECALTKVGRIYICVALVVVGHRLEASSHLDELYLTSVSQATDIP